MARELNWTDTEEIGIQLQEMFPETDPYSVRFTDLHKWVVQLPNFVGDPAKSNEGILEAIQTAKYPERARGKVPLFKHERFDEIRAKLRDEQKG